MLSIFARFGVVLIFAIILCNCIQFPKMRKFLPLPGSYGIKENSNPVILRVFQFNVLADGLAGLRPDRGNFNLATDEILLWENRKMKLIHEITQYEPDIVTLQEVDHYYDFFLPMMMMKGYSGFYARYECIILFYTVY